MRSRRTTFLSLWVFCWTISPATAADTEATEPSRRKSDAANASEFYDPGVVQTIRLDVPEADLRKLRDALPERIYVPATFRWRDHVLERVGLRYKGDSSSRPDQRHKRSFAIKFSEFVKGQEFLGLRRVALDNGVQFGGLFSERIITDILRELGAPASRTNYARVELNGENVGVYVNVERIDRTFLETHLGDAMGELYKVHKGGPGADFRYLGDDPLLYTKAFEIKAGKSTAQLADLVRFFRELRDTPDQALAEHLRSAFEIDAFLSQMAVLLLSGAFDQYTGWGPHNYYLHRDPRTGRWRYLTWDLDVGFADRAFGRIPVIDGWHAAWPVPNVPRPLLERIVGNEELLGLYRDRAKRVLEEHFRPESIARRLDSLHALIRDDLAKDPFPNRRATVPTDRSYDDVVASMKSFARRRFELAREQLANPGERPKPQRRPTPERGAGRGGPRPGAPSADAPSELKVVRSGPNGVELSWKDNATGERAFIVQRCEGADCETFDNVKGIPEENVRSATDEGIVVGKTYRYRVYAVKPTERGASGTGVSNVVTVRVGGEKAKDPGDGEKRGERTRPSRSPGPGPK